MNLILILVGVIYTIIAYAIFYLRNKKYCNGSLIVSDEGLYLSLSEEDMNIIKKSDFVTLKVSRKNFN